MDMRLDASESVFFARQLEAIDAKMYEQVYPELRARSFLPRIGGVAEWQKVYTYRMFDKAGAGAFIADGADDLPTSEVKGTETSQLIKVLGGSYRYSMMEIKHAAGTGTPLEQAKANACRYNVEKLLDDVLATGNSDNGLSGLLNLSNTTSFTPATKAAGGLTWGTLAAPNATGEEVANDLMGLVTAVVNACKGEISTRFRIVLPLEQYNYAAQKRLGAFSDTTALKFALATSPFIASIDPWIKCDAAGASSADRMACFPADNPDVLGALIPMEFTTLPAQQRGLNFIVPAMLSTGGVVCRYPVAVGYGDGI